MQTGQSADAARVGQGRVGQGRAGPKKRLAPLKVKVKVAGTRRRDSGSDCPTAPELVAWPLVGCALVSGWPEPVCALESSFSERRSSMQEKI